MRLELTDNIDDVFYITTHPDLIEDISDKNSSELSLEDYKKAIEYTMKDYLHIKVVDDSDNIAGLFNCHDDNGDLEVHINMLKKYRKDFAVLAAKSFIELVFNETGYNKIVAKVPSKFLNVFKFVSNLGFKLDHMVEKDYKAEDDMYDIYCFSLSKE